MKNPDKEDTRHKAPAGRKRVGRRHVAGGAVEEIVTPRRRWWPRTRLAWTAAVLGVVVIVMIGLAGGYLWLLSSRINHVNVAFPSSDEGTTWVLVGSDSRSSVPGGPDFYSPSPGSHADAIIVIHIDRSKTTILSIPRDTIVSPTPDSVSRLTLTLDEGPQYLVDGLCRTLHIPATRLVIITMKAFAGAVDSLGGVTVYNPAPIRDRYSGLNIPQTGDVHLGGLQLLALARSRHPQTLTASGWLQTQLSQGAQDRTRNVGVAFKALAAKARSARSAPFQLLGLAWAVTGGLTTDQNTGLFNLLNLPLDTSKVEDLPVDILGPDALAATIDKATETTLQEAGYTQTCQTDG